MRIEQTRNEEDNTIDLIAKGSIRSKDFRIATFYPKPWYSEPDRETVIRSVVIALEGVLK